MWCWWPICYVGVTKSWYGWHVINIPKLFTSKFGLRHQCNRFGLPRHDPSKEPIIPTSPIKSTYATRANATQPVSTSFQTSWFYHCFFTIFFNKLFLIQHFAFVINQLCMSYRSVEWRHPPDPNLYRGFSGVFLAQSTQNPKSGSRTRTETEFTRSPDLYHNQLSSDYTHYTILRYSQHLLWSSVL